LRSDFEKRAIGEVQIPQRVQSAQDRRGIC
jgi:hypothetical protein